MTRRGMTLIELLIVIVIVGAVAGLAYPRVADGLRRESVRAARLAITGLHAKARANAIQRGRTSALVRSGDLLLIVSRNPVTGQPDTIGQPMDVNLEYGGAVAMSWTRDTLTFDARGIGQEATATTIVVSRGTYADTIVVSPVGRIVQ